MVSIALGPRDGEGTAQPAGSDPGRGSSATPWLAFLRKRVAGLVLAFLVTVVGTFMLVPLIPGDPAASAAGEEATPEKVALVREQLGLDRPLLERLLDYVGGLFTGDLGHSFSYNAPVAEIIGSRLPHTLGLAGSALGVSLLIAVPLGILVCVLTQDGRRPGISGAFNIATAFIASIPIYVLGTILVVGLALTTMWFPPAYSPSRPVWSLVLPVVAMALPTIAGLSRVVRRECAVVLRQDYMRTARGWRISPIKQYLKYALPNLATSTLTLAGATMVGMLGGAISIEAVFGVPGLGSGIVQAVISRDYPLIQGIVLVVAMIAVTFTFLVDLALAAIDPRLLKGESRV